MWHKMLVNFTLVSHNVCRVTKHMEKTQLKLSAIFECLILQNTLYNIEKGSGGQIVKTGAGKTWAFKETAFYGSVLINCFCPWL